MNLSDDLEKLLLSFRDLMDESKELVTENEKNKRLVKEKVAELAEQAAKCELMERNLKQQQELLELYNQQLSLIPELKSDIEKLNMDICQLEARLEHKEQEMAKLKQKHLADLNFLRLEIEEERLKSREAENMRLMDLEEFYKQAQVAEVSSRTKRIEREKHSLAELLDRKEEQLRNIATEHQEELEKLRIQLVAAKTKENSSSPSAFSSEFYRKKIMAMQEHYETQIQELVDSKLPAKSYEQQVSPPKTPPKTPGGPPSNPVIPSTPMIIPDDVDEFDLMAAGSGRSLKDKVFKAPTTYQPTPTSSEEPKKKKKKVTFRLSSSQTDKVNQRDNVGSNTEVPIHEQSSHSFSTPTNRNKRRDTTVGFQYPPAPTTPQSSNSRTPGGPLNEDFWSSINKESLPFMDVSFSRVSPKKTSTVTSAFSRFQPQSPVASSFSIPSHMNNNSSFVNSRPQSKFKFSNIISRSQSGNVTDFGSFHMADLSSAHGDTPDDPQAQDRGMKRKLFSQQFGPKEL